MSHLLFSDEASALGTPREQALLLPGCTQMSRCPQLTGLHDVPGREETIHSTSSTHCVRVGFMK